MIDYSYKIQSNDMANTPNKKNKNKKSFNYKNFLLVVLSIILITAAILLLSIYISEKNNINSNLNLNHHNNIFTISTKSPKKFNFNSLQTESDQMNEKLREISLNLTYFTDKYYNTTSQEEKYKLGRIMHKLYYYFSKQLNKEKRLIDEKNNLENRNIYHIKRFSDGDVYYGEVNKKDEMDGYGYYFGDKFTYSGEFSNNLMNGKCAIYYKDGYYKGYIVNEELEGKGIIQLDNGEKYEGEFKNNNFNGFGVYYEKNGIYEGTWKDGLKNGKGKYTSKNNDTYVGDFKNGKIEGFGKLTYNNGAYYEGNFLDNLFHGKGKYKSSDGKVFEGVWTKGIINKKNE